MTLGSGIAAASICALFGGLIWLGHGEELILLLIVLFCGAPWLLLLRD